MDKEQLMDKVETIIYTHLNDLEYDIQESINDLKIEYRDNIISDIKDLIDEELLDNSNNLNELVKQLNNKSAKNNNDIIKILQFAGVKNYILNQQNGTLTITIKEN